MPLQNGRISSNFGARRDPINGRQRQHNGIDIAAPRGTPIDAAGDGTVVFAGWQRGYGNTVIVEHADGRRTRYGHAEKLFVQPGETVEAGQVIAAVGSTGRSTGPHLHFEVIEADRRIDPLRALANDLTLARR
jgi:murein DD-endopeptidase MepM/ murein hydrolase activator NlpD